MKRIEVLDDGLKFVQEHPKMFFLKGCASPEELLSKMVCESILFGSNRTLIEKFCDNYIFCSDVDWVSEGISFSRREAFDKVIPFPEFCQNSLRCAVIVHAFSKSVAVYDRAGKSIIKGDVAAGVDDKVASLLEQYRFIVSFELETESVNPTV